MPAYAASLLEPQPDDTMRGLTTTTSVGIDCSEHVPTTIHELARILLECSDAPLSTFRLELA